MWTTIDDLDREIVSIAYQRIRELAGASPDWPAAAVVESAYRRIRTLAAAEARVQERRPPLDGSADRAASDERSAAERLAIALMELTADGTVQRKDAEVLYSTRVLGMSFAEVAQIQGRKVATVRHHRARVERALIAAAGRDR